MPPPPLDPLACVKCGALLTSPADAVVRCPACGKEFLLRRGRGSNAAVPVVSVDLREAELKLRAPGAFTAWLGVLRPTGIAYGMLDPVVGRVMMESGDVPYHQIASIAAWRERSLLQVLSFVLFTVPFGGGITLALILSRNVIAMVLGVGLAALVALHFHRTFILKAARIRVISVAGRVLDMTFLSKPRARARFFEVLQQRSGLDPLPMP